MLARSGGGRIVGKRDGHGPNWKHAGGKEALVSERQRPVHEALSSIVASLPAMLSGPPAAACCCCSARKGSLSECNHLLPALRSPKRVPTLFLIYSSFT